MTLNDAVPGTILHASNETTSAEDRALILKIADRAMADGPASYTDKIRAVMDLCIVHCNGCASTYPLSCPHPKPTSGTTSTALRQTSTA